MVLGIENEGRPVAELFSDFSSYLNHVGGTVISTFGDIRWKHEQKVIQVERFYEVVSAWSN
jgi:hypothetical protein